MAWSGSILMPKLEDHFDEIDLSRTRRIRELSEIKRAFCGPVGDDPLDVRSRALVVLSYAAWEGFYNECVETYCGFLAAEGRRIVELSWNMLVGALRPELDALRDRRHSSAARLEFVEGLKTGMARDCHEFDRTVVMARSNLDFDKLRHNFKILDLDIGPIQKYRNKIDRELVGWRHRVAHGDSPQLSNMDGAKHMSLVGDVMALVADAFQEAMLRREGTGAAVDST